MQLRENSLTSVTHSNVWRWLFDWTFSTAMLKDRFTWSRTKNRLVWSMTDNLTHPPEKRTESLHNLLPKETNIIVSFHLLLLNLLTIFFFCCVSWSPPFHHWHYWKRQVFCCRHFFSFQIGLRLKDVQLYGLQPFLDVWSASINMYFRGQGPVTAL